MSEIARKTGVKQLRVRELIAVRFWATLKAIVLSIAASGLIVGGGH